MCNTKITINKVCFTLSELLVVISIIMILTGFLLPSLNKAKGYSRRISCANTLNQIGKAFCMYVQDNKDCLPPYRDSGSPEHFWVYENSSTGLLSEYLGTSNPYNCIGAIKDVGGITYKSKYICPSLTSIPTAYGYGYNQRIYATPSNLLITRFRKPSRLCLLSESKTAAIVTHYIGEYPIEFRHFSGVNIVFADFHTEWKKSVDVNNNASTSDFWRVE